MSKQLITVNFLPPVLSSGVSSLLLFISDGVFSLVFFCLLGFFLCQVFSSPVLFWMFLSDVFSLLVFFRWCFSAFVSLWFSFFGVFSAVLFLSYLFLLCWCFSLCRFFSSWCFFLLGFLFAGVSLWRFSLVFLSGVFLMFLRCFSGVFLWCYSRRWETCPRAVSQPIIQKQGSEFISNSSWLPGNISRRRARYHETCHWEVSEPSSNTAISGDGHGPFVRASFSWMNALPCADFGRQQPVEF